MLVEPITTLGNATQKFSRPTLNLVSRPEVSTNAHREGTYLYHYGKIPRQCLACPPMYLLLKLQSADVKKTVVE